MGDKISQLPSATSVDGTELVPIVQGGATKKVTGLILRNPAGPASGDLTGNYPNPTLAAITTGQVAVGSGSAIPVITTDEKGRVTALTTAANSALTTNQIAGLSTEAGAALATAGAVGLSAFAARADHQHARPTPGEIGALGATAAAGGDLVGNFPNPTLAAITSAQSNVGSGSAVPVISVDAKGRVTGLSTIGFTALTTAQIAGLATDAAAALATSGVVGLSSFAARSDHQHPFPTAAQVGALGATATAGGDLTGSYPVPTLAAITTAQSNVGGASSIPVLSIDAKGRVTALSSVPAAGGSSNATFLQGTPISSATPTIGQGLIYAAPGEWVPQTLTPSANATSLQGVAISATGPNSGETLIYNSSIGQWEPAAVEGNATSINGVSCTVGTPADNNALIYNPIQGWVPGDVNAVKIQAQSVSATTPSTGQVLQYNGSEWEPAAPSVNATSLQGTGVSSTAPTSGNLLKFDGTNWAPFDGVGIPNWNNLTSYNVGDVVWYGGKIWIAKTYNVGQQPQIGSSNWAENIGESNSSPSNPSTPQSWLRITTVNGDGWFPIYI